MRKVEEFDHYKKIFLKELDPVIEGYICVETPILSEKPVCFYRMYAYQYINYNPWLNVFREHPKSLENTGSKKDKYKKSKL